MLSSLLVLIKKRKETARSHRFVVPSCFDLSHETESEKSQKAFQCSDCDTKSSVGAGTQGKTNNEQFNIK